MLFRSNKGIWTAKKRYILNVYDNEGVRYTKPKIKVMGLEMVKSSTPMVVRDKMYELVELIVSTDEEIVQKFIADFKQEFLKLPPEDISFPRGLNGLNEYSDAKTIYKKGTPIHVKGAILYNHYLKEYNITNKYPLLKEGEKLKFTYLKVPNPFKDTVISFPTRLPKEFELQNYVDYETQFEKTFIDPVQIILTSIGWNTEKKSTLEDFFG